MGAPLKNRNVSPGLQSADLRRSTHASCITTYDNEHYPSFSPTSALVLNRTIAALRFVVDSQSSSRNFCCQLFQERLKSLKLLPGDVLFKMIYLKAKSDTLLVCLAGISIWYFQMVFEFMAAFFQVNQPNLLFWIIFHGDIDTAFAEIWIEGSNFITEFFF